MIMIIQLINQVKDGKELLEDLVLKNGQDLDEDGAAQDGTDFRVILRYDFPIL